MPTGVSSSAPVVSPRRLVVDGRLADEVYATTEPLRGLVQQDPDPGASVTEPTDVWVFFDDRALYVTFRRMDPHPERAVENDLRRDGTNFGNNDHVSVGLDTFHDGRNGAVFGVTSAGGLNDGLASNERDYNRDWNTVWEARTSRFDGGWSAELAIPFRSLRYPGGGGQIWGINVRRTIRWKNEYAYLTPIPPSLGMGGIMKFSSAATLVGLTLPAARPIAELKPYVIGGLKTDWSADPAVEGAFDRHAGFDAKYGLTPSLTADFTYNTDFAQVEDDEQQVNLTRFSLFFPEKREFFLENQGMFNFGGYGQRRGATPGDMPLLFFSRRIGLSAGGRPVPISAGGRMTGKAGAFNVGLVDIQTKDDAATGSPATNFAVVRVSRDILRRSMVGAYFTRRSVSAAAPEGATWPTRSTARSRSSRT
ncbi:MAG: carbohydrate binding family 9 domain-containing protein [Acidobacteria bacterium]|nr:carbohydrate binding family 9 domain-containing protein [Acidobacteriota bacterium]